ncbi:MAG: lipopolysaccharide heptosyltransferase II [Rhizobiales bacterium]|nr:lipopolysaccharide heptosyltransferase II [Hyphomicrobiales bacterium]
MRHALLRKLLAGAMTVAAVIAFEAGASTARADGAMGALASAGDAGGIGVVGDSGGIHETLPLALNKSKIIELPRDARDVLISNPSIANAVIRTPRQIYITGLTVGQTNIIIFDRAGRQIVTLDLAVERGGLDLSALMRRLLPTSNVTVDVLNDNIVLSGTVANAADAKQAEKLAEAFIGNARNNGDLSSTKASGGGDGPSMTVVSSTNITGADDKAQPSRVINMLTIEGEDQVHLKVTVAEVQRNIAKQLGLDLQGGISIGQFAVGLATDNPFSVAGKAITNTLGQIGGGDTGSNFESGTGKNFNNGLFGQLRALDQTGMVRTLAEPTLTAISGESASFLAGGEFPVPTGRDQDGNITITYKPFGVSLAFTPVVLGEGRISLHVKTEVSELSSENSVQLSGLSLPSIAFCPGAEYGPAKRWPAEKFAALAGIAHQGGYRVRLFGGPKDKPITAEIAAKAGVPVDDLAGRTSLLDASVLLGLSDVVVSNDTGLMHVAGALDRPLVVLYGSSSERLTPPTAPNAEALSLELSCRPCFQRTCPLGTLACL